MKSREADKIRVRFYELQPSYEKLAAELRRVLDHATRFPNGAVYGALLDRFKTIYTQELNREPFRSKSSDELDRADSQI